MKDEGLMFENDLPEMIFEEYLEWYSKSRIIDGVRMGPIILRSGKRLQDCNTCQGYAFERIGEGDNYKDKCCRNCDGTGKEFLKNN